MMNAINLIIIKIIRIEKKDKDDLLINNLDDTEKEEKVLLEKYLILWKLIEKAWIITI